MSGRFMTMKSDADFEKMKVAGAVVAAVHAAVRKAVAPGVSTLELDAIAHQVIRDADCRPSFLGYHGFPASICSSPNEVIVHGIPDGYKLRDGDIISIDAGAIYDGWHGDAAFTMAVGEISAEARQLIEVTEQGLWAGIAAAQPGNRLGDVGAAISAVAAPYGYGVVREYIGHGIGRQMHEAPDVPNYGKAGKGLKLKPGMAIAIEPMFNLGTAETSVLEDGWTVITQDGKLSAHWEHTVLITKQGALVSTLPEPKLVSA
jgi:methionyl aminopeptidase